jgi:hypothetical protein
MSSNLPWTPGSGAEIKTDQGGTTSAHMQVVKLAQSTLGSETLIPADSSGLLVNVSGIVGTVPVSATASAPVSVRLSNGSASVDTLPVTVGNSVTVSGSVSVSNSPTVSGTVTANQGTAASLSSAWPVKITDGTNSVNLSTVGSAIALDVNVVSPELGTQVDKSNFVEGTGITQVIAAVLNDSPVGAPSQNQAAALRINSARGLHINLRDSSGNELGTTSNPLVVLNSAPSGITAWRFHYSYTASMSATAMHTPASGKTANISGFIITAITQGIVTLFENTDGNTAEFFNGQLAAGAVLVCPYTSPMALSLPNYVLKLSTGSGATGDILIWGYDA